MRSKESRPVNSKPPELWYFAYGANMDRATLVERRGIEPAGELTVTLDGYELVFNQKGIPWLEPSFANLRVAEAQSVHGVAYGLTEAQLEELDALEGGGAYDHLEVTVRASDGRILLAKTYFTSETVEKRYPSARYMGLLLRGGREHGLPDDWITRLEVQRTGGLKSLGFVAPVLMGTLEFFFRIQLSLRRLFGG
jgi:gamma-glutamylcyclotransferase (GGCT)/AIG2-like uncharacterized protein YtfP